MSRYKQLIYDAAKPVQLLLSDLNNVGAKAHEQREHYGWAVFSVPPSPSPSPSP